MPSYFINSRSRTGRGLPFAVRQFANVGAVRRGCARDAKQLVINALQDGGTFDEAIDDGFEVTDFNANIVLSMTFAEAVQIKTRPA